jgi:hypothetical protein
MYKTIIVSVLAGYDRELDIPVYELEAIECHNEAEFQSALRNISPSEIVDIF